MPLLCIEGTANFPYQILLVSFHLQYRNDFVCIYDLNVIILAFWLFPEIINWHDVISIEFTLD